MNLFNDLVRNQATALLDSAFHSFMEQIAVYQTPEKTYIQNVTDDPNFSFSYAVGQEPDVQWVVQSGVFNATIEYLDQSNSQKKDYSNKSEPVQLPLGLVRICVSGDDARKMLLSSEKVVFDNMEFKIVSDVAARGLFQRNYTDFWLQKPDLNVR